MKLPIIAAAALCAAPALADTPVLTVYTYDSFVADWGPGPQIEAAFEETCNCDLKFVGAGDGAALLSRLQLEGSRSEADIVLGLDTNLTAAARETGLFADHGISADFDLPVAWDDPTFLPYDWGYFAFVYDKTRLETPPASFTDLIAAPDDLKVVIQDPRSSTPGLGLMLWVKAAYGADAADIWAGLAPHVLTVTKGWSESYGLFLDGEADMVLSYTTSPAYHLIAEEDDTKAAAAFAEGHYMQIEVAGRLAASDQPELADAFLRFMLSDAFQAVIPTTNWMYPAVTPAGGLPGGFDTLITPDRALIYSAQEAAQIRDAALAEWRDGLSR
ncbi:thiamine ABC transporter substrate binding subunit [Rhodovulum adriaticum]|uniref:Thiamine-binding periplasmic protein n=1 Tax=Rhodovulum adriaticum TaxID=35804 RepID=A0A4R2NZM3_RHOAD|nr:thiamine ABC transporter substrate binding subunit [Rhodovulum adriaticum]MBK1635316.1 thiamine ABC transporter substrate binding subunit [Rhodovulum adriaticum]TCP27750.1 thiamine transport system substrate-binding protein [Rhodovulum adriaticum]